MKASIARAFRGAAAPLLCYYAIAVGVPVSANEATPPTPHWSWSRTAGR